MLFKSSFNQRFSRCFWTSLVAVTVLACGILLYVSCLRKGGIQISSLKYPTVKAEKLLAQRNCENICRSKDCIIATDFILSLMDESVDPCEDFYAFSCGGWRSRFTINDTYSILTSMELNLKNILKGILDKAEGAPESSTEKMKIVYDSCMNDSSSELIMPAFLNFLKELGIPDWPNLSSDFQFINPTIEEFLAILAAHNQPAFLQFTSDKSEEEINSEEKLLNMTVSPFYVLTIPDRTVGTFRNVMFGILKYLNVDHPTANRTWQEFLTTNDEIRRIAEVDWDEICEDCEEDSVVLDCTGEVEDNLKPVCNILRAVVNYTGIGDQYSSLGAFISEAKYVKSLFPLLTNFTHKAIADYLMLRLIMNNMDDMNFILRLLLQESFEDLLQTPFKYNLNKWKHCVGWISFYMPYALGVEYVSKFLPRQKLKKIDKIVRTFINEAADYTMSQEWIAEDARLLLSHQIRNMSSNLNSHVESLANETAANHRYSEYHPTRKSFFENVLNYHKAAFIYRMRKHDSLDGNFNDPFVFNAFQYDGHIDLRLGVLLPPVYLPGLPEPLNYATMGPVIGHEIGHEINLFFGHNENVDNITKENFLEKGKCIEDKYSEYDIRSIGKKLEGNETVIENMADFIGLKLMEKTVERKLDQMGARREPLLPELNYTTNQLLYISLAQMWCSVRSPKVELHHYKHDSHAPPDARVINMLQNSERFSEVFNCSVGSGMNPIHKCAYYD
ncbi:Endothelin-converting enzyme 1, partial [Stegodyphus mimosarum]